VKCYTDRAYNQGHECACATAHMIEDASSIRVTKRGVPVDVTYYRDGQKFQRKKKFRRYVQIIYGNKVVWFKEFGDPRIMDIRNGNFGDSTP
jgi:capsid portal protein